MDKGAMYQLMNQQLEGLLRPNRIESQGLQMLLHCCGKLLGILTGQDFISSKMES